MKYYYDITCYEWDRENMAYIFEYCEKYCLELYNVQIDREKFINAFMVSNLRREMENGFPDLIFRAAKEIIKKYVEVDLEGDIEQFRGEPSKGYEKGQWYKAGEIYTYIHYYNEKTSRKLLELIPLKDMLRMCNTDKTEEELYRYLIESGWLFSRKKSKGYLEEKSIKYKEMSK